MYIRKVNFSDVNRYGCKLNGENDVIPDDATHVIWFNR